MMGEKQLMRAGSLLSMLCLAWSLQPHSATASIPTPGAEIVSVKGKGEYRPAATNEWKRAVPKVGLGPGSLVRAGDQSVVNLLLSDQTQTSIGSNGMLEIKQVADAGKLGTILKLNSGKSWSSSKNVPANMRIETPSASGLIRGTDWQMEVAEDGTSILTVLSGEVELENDKGSIRVFPGEQGRAAVGVAPTKIVLTNPRDRVQWVSSFAVDLSQYRELDVDGPLNRVEAAELDSLLMGGDYLKAEKWLVHRAEQKPAEPLAWLLQSDLAVMNGDLARATKLLQEGSARFPKDERFDVWQARGFLLWADAISAARALAVAEGKNTTSPEVQMASGELARYEGRAQDALSYYARALELLQATKLGAASAYRNSTIQRALLGLGRILTEREDVGKARNQLQGALALDSGFTAARSELGMLEVLADRPVKAQEQFAAILAKDPQDFVALTGTGLALLKQGKTAEALEPLLAATLIEPRYARAQMAVGIAYYQQGRLKNALFALSRAKDADPNDPLPHMLEGIMFSDQGDYGRAIAASRSALQRMPYLKSLNQIAVDQKGQANLGSNFADFGLENWARSYAMDSYTPLWAASHLFMADRYSGDFNKKSELFQGFLSDPTVFGASNRFSSLIRQPGHFGSVGVRATGSDEFHLRELTLTTNGYANEYAPVAYFGEVIQTLANPGTMLFNARASTYIVALGVKPTFEAGFFVYANLLDAKVLAGSGDANLPQSVSAQSDINGKNSRVDMGAHWRLRPDSQMWLKLGSGTETSQSEILNQTAAPLGAAIQRGRFSTSPDLRDVQFRHTFIALGAHEISWGMEWANATKAKSLVQEIGYHYGSAAIPSDSLLQSDSDVSVAGWISDTMPLSDTTKLQLDLAWQRYSKSRSINVLLDRLAPLSIPLAETYDVSGTLPRLGISTVLAPGLVVRGAYQQWVRPASVSTLASVATAGIALDDSLILAGGSLTRRRLQLDWEATPMWFFNGFVDTKDVKNLWSPLDGVLNTRADVSNLDRLRQRSIPNLAAPDQQEAASIFSAGKVSSAGFAASHVLSSRMVVYAAVQANDSSVNGVEDPARRVPYVPKEQLALGLTATGKERTVLKTQLLWRGGRYADEANLVYVAPNWEISLNAHLEAPSRAWSLDGYVSGPLNRSGARLVGVNALARF